MNRRENDLSCKTVVSMDQKIMQCSIVNPSDAHSPPKNFSFDGVYFVNSTTEAIYNDIASPLVEGVLEGYNGTVFAYGQTGCGKSFSMQGISDPPTQRGIIPRAFEHIFEAIATADNSKYLVHASYLEIYNEEIRDLLGKDIKKKLDLKEHPDKGVYIPELSKHPVHNVHECESLMDRGWNNRSTGATLMNADSSRSHSIFTIMLEMMTVNEDGSEHIRQGKLNLVDLAGSERQAKTGNTKTLMVACLSPADNNYEETLSTLRYANRAKNIKNKPKINEDPKDAMLREYQEEIQKLRAMLDSNGAVQISKQIVVPDEKALEAEREKVRREYEQKMTDMQKQLQQAKAQQNKPGQSNQEEVEAVKRKYEQQLKELNQKIEANASNAGVTRAMSAGLGQQASIVQKLAKNLDPEKAEAIQRLKNLEKQMVGGEKANDVELKNKRVTRRKNAERRMETLAAVLNAVSQDNDDAAVLAKVYDDINEEVKSKTELAKKYKNRVKVLEQEISDLTSEFESDRTDYLETIRKQDQQIKLLQQILDRAQPAIKKESNYSNIEKIKQEAFWEDETQRWKLPEMIITRTKLPKAAAGGASVEVPERSVSDDLSTRRRKPSVTAPAKLAYSSDEDEDTLLLKVRFPNRLGPGSQQSSGSTVVSNAVGRYRRPPSSVSNGQQSGSSGTSDELRFRISNNNGRVSRCSLLRSNLNSENILVDSSDSQDSSPPEWSAGYSCESDDEKILQQKLERGQEENIAGTYFSKSTRQAKLLEKARKDSHVNGPSWRGDLSKNKSSSTSVLNQTISLSPEMLVNGNLSNSCSLNGSWDQPNSSNSWGGTSNVGVNNWFSTNGYNINPMDSMRKPTRLQALPDLDRGGGIRATKKRSRAGLNTLDLI
ncbi:unnamed protein product [Notodromas monacha]|uniref:Kinesin-like protein n=2 Tax=Notodromas monacha TaxID=399045 RepID=A0A7R9GJ25_9CRUS|nr:unnamed protein product [Notodromas monacha]CAG0923076.1 unnamed protein product [Notodromas monacha]